MLALTFTVRAAGELRGQAPRSWASGWRGRPRSTRPRCASSTTSGRGSSGDARRSWSTARPAWCARPPSGPRSAWTAAPGHLADAAGEIEWAKVTQVRPDGYPAAAAAAGRSPAAGAASLAAVYAAYEELRRERHLIDFESVLELTAAILLDNRTAADQVRDLFRHFVVDEYQDVNPLQKLLLDAWLGDRDDLCVVGDPHQVIYSFTGATPAYLTGFTAEFPGATVVRLVRDYRSTPQVVAVANQLARTAAPLVAQRPPGRRRCSPSTPTTPRRRPGSRSRSRRCGPGAYRSARSPCWSGSTPTPSGSSGRWPKPGCPYVVRGAERFYERPVVRQALVLLRGAARGEAAADRGPGARGDPLPSAVRHVLTGIGPDRRARAAGGAGARGNAGSRSPRSRSSPTTCTRRARRRRWPTSRPS